MSNNLIIEDGVLKGYTGEGNVIIPDEVTSVFGAPFCDFCDPFEITLSNNMVCSFGDVLSQGIVKLNIKAGTEFKCSSCYPSNTSFYKLLESINVDPENPYCTSVDGMLLNKEKTILYACPPANEGNKGVIVVPDTVEIIADKAFGGCTKIKEIILPTSLKTIGEKAFADCKALKKLVLPDGIETIGKEAFLRCGKLTNAGLKGSTKKGYAYEFPWEEEIIENAFSGMNKLQKVVLPETITKIGKGAFKGCKSLVEINLREDVKCDKKTFKDCTKLSV